MGVLGGIYLPLYLILSIVIYHVLDRYTNWIWICYTLNSFGKGIRLHYQLYSVFIYTLQSVVGIPLKYHLRMNIVRFIDNVIIIGIVIVFAFWEFECGSIGWISLCADGLQRNAMYNPLVLILIITAVIGTVVGFAVYLILWKLKIV